MPDPRGRYSRELRAAVRGLWASALSLEQAFDSFDYNIRGGLTAAWHLGMKSVGLQPVDMTAEEKLALSGIIQREIERVFPFLLEVEQGNRESGIKLGKWQDRTALWSNRFADVESRARVMAQNDPKLAWALNVTRQPEVNCPTCLRLEGKVKRASYWKRVGVRPQNPPNSALICGGWLCGCALLPTDDPLSRGPLPSTP